MIRRGSDVENSPEIVWQELAPDLWEARLVEPTGLTVYAGYMAQSADADPWRGYIGIDFVFVARGGARGGAAHARRGGRCSVYATNIPTYGI